MSDSEKLARHDKLYKVVTTHTSHTWAAVLVKMLLGQINSANQARMTPYIPKEVLVNTYQTAKKRLFLFDYDVRFFLVWLSFTFIDARHMENRVPSLRSSKHHHKPYLQRTPSRLLQNSQRTRRMSCTLSQVVMESFWSSILGISRILE